MALKGTLRDFSLADIFQLIGIQRKTGVLTLKSDKEVVTVSFADGHVVAADSLHRRLEDRLGTVLVKTGRISEAQLQEALRIQKNTLKRMGDVLVDSRFIDAEALRDALAIQISQMIYRLFRWRDGEYNFSQEERVDYDAKHVVPMSAESILMEGARILDEWPMIEKGLKSFQTLYRRANVEIAPEGAGGLSASGEDAARGVTLTAQDRQIHALVDGKRLVQDIVERSPLGEFETCRILFELLGRQLIEEVRTEAPRAAQAVTATPASRETSPLLLGVGYLVLVLAAGGGLLARARPCAAAWSGGGDVTACVDPLARPEEVIGLRNSISRGRLQRIDFALQVYYLLNRGFPSDLHYLVTTRLLGPEAIKDPWGDPFLYEVKVGGYRLASTPRSGLSGSFEIDSSASN